MGEENRNSKNIRDFQGLLRACVEATRSEDAPNPSTFQEMDAEKRQFLENALKSMTIDVIEELEKAVQTAGNISSTLNEKLAALDVVANFVDNMDTANDFIKVGGLGVIIPLLKSDNNQIRSKAASIIADLAQNNEYSQQQLLDANVIPILIDLLSNDETAVSAIHAISCEVRHYGPSQEAFIKNGGLECIIACLQRIGQEKLFIRSLFLMNSLCADMDSIRNDFVKLNAVETIIKTVEPTSDYNAKLEIQLATLNQLTENDQALNECRKSNWNLLQTLEEIDRTSQNKSECQETLEYAQMLIEKIFKSSSDGTAER